MISANTDSITWDAGASGGYIFSPNTGIYTSPTSSPNVPSPGSQEVRQLREDMAAENIRTNAVLKALVDKIDSMSKLIENDTSVMDRKEAKRKIHALEEQLEEFRQYYDESLGTIYKK